MNPALLTLALLCGLQVTQKDGKLVRRSDMAPMSETELIDAIGAAIAAYKSAAAAPAAEADTGDADIAAELEAAKAKVAELEGQLSAMKADEKSRKDAADAAADLIERTALDALATKLGYTPTWRTDTKTSERKLDIARHKGLVAKDAVAPSDATLTGMIAALRHLHTDGATTDAFETTTAAAWDGVVVAPGGSRLTAEPFSARKDRKPDPFKARLTAQHSTK